MKRLSDYVLLFVGGLMVALSLAAFQKHPGYMDAEYYFATAQIVHEGGGLYEPFIWNYLTGIKGLLAPSFTYWMPFTSLLALAGMIVAGRSDWNLARIFFVLLTAFLPVLTYSLGWYLSRKRFVALFSGMLAWFPVFFTPYLVTTDAFVLYMYLGSAWFVLTKRALQQNWSAVLLIGFISGLMHFTRNDGLIWFLIFLFVLMIVLLRNRSALRSFFGLTAIALVGYGIVMSPWYLRNLHSFGTFFPSGNQRMLWLRHYNDIFSYPASQLTYKYWLESGLDNIFMARAEAVGQNILSTIAVQFEIVLLPLALMGLFALRKKIEVQMMSLVWICIFFLMSVIFPFAGYRGGYFHAIAAFQPFIWCLSAIGLVSFNEWGVAKRNWNGGQTLKVFALFLLFICAALSFRIVAQRIIGSDLRNPNWSRSANRYNLICEAMNDIIQGDDGVVMVNNPVGYFLACRQKAVVIPSGGIPALKAVASQYHVKHLILENDHPPELNELYAGTLKIPDLILLYSHDDWQIYLIEEHP
jgi:4-amino-4-deoxy-L-arabinose transferase-like glycosyltransferase